MNSQTSYSQQKMIKQIAPFAEVNGRCIEEVLTAMRQIPRHEFLGSVWQQQAYDEKNLPIGKGQTISLPSIVCQMTSLLYANSHYCKLILEVGTGTGYQSAVLAKLWQQVYTIERIASLSHKAQNNHRKLGLHNISYAIADGYLGWHQEINFDAIMLTAWVSQVPESLLNQLKVGGYLLAPVGNGEQQVLKLYKRQGQQRFSEEAIVETLFVPMLNGIDK